MPAGDLPAPVVAALGVDGDLVGAVRVEPIRGSSGAATGELVRLTGTVREPSGATRQVRVVAKTVRPLAGSRHAAHADEPDHWAYWRRELLAYGSGVLPPGPGLRAPRLYAVVGSTIYMEDAGGIAENPRVAAARLGRWQATSSVPAYDWLAVDQLAQRVAVTDLDWSALRADHRMATLWSARWDLLDQLARLPGVLTHGDFGIDNVLRCGRDTVAVDWGTLGVAPLGADLAYLALSTGADLTAEYLAGAGERTGGRDALAGYRATLALVGPSRLHWMMANGHAIPPWYADLIWDARPRL